jgi:hypothetical protein
MNEDRWLLPFTFGVDTSAITTAVLQAAACNTTLVAVSLVVMSNTRRGVRLERLQQSQDFLETVQQLACRYQVPLEHHEVLTYASGAALADEIERLAHEFRCRCCVIVTSKEREILLCKDELCALLTKASLSFLLCRLSPQTEQPSLAARLRFLFSELRHNTFG